MKKVHVDIMFGHTPIKGTIIIADDAITWSSSAPDLLASEKQKYKMKQLGIPYTDKTSSHEAWQLINDAMKKEQEHQEPLPWEEPKRRRGRPRKNGIL